jgi:DNA-binding XRE family transcriptional regulator
MPFKKVNISELLKEELNNDESNEKYNSLRKEYELIEQIVRIRKNLNITQAELAEKANVSQQAISRLEKEKHIPKIDTLLKIVDGLGLKLVLTER